MSTSVPTDHHRPFPPESRRSASGSPSGPPAPCRASSGSPGRRWRRSASPARSARPCIVPAKDGPPSIAVGVGADPTPGRAPRCRCRVRSCRRIGADARHEPRRRRRRRSVGRGAGGDRGHHAGALPLRRPRRTTRRVARPGRVALADRRRPRPTRRPRPGRPRCRGDVPERDPRPGTGEHAAEPPDGDATWPTKAVELAAEHGLEVEVFDKDAARGAGLRRHARRQRRLDRAAAHGQAHVLAAQPEGAPGARRQGRHVRLGRHQPQAEQSDATP